MKNLVWNGKRGYIERDDVGNELEKKPTIRGLTFDELYYEESLKLKVVDGKSVKLSKDEERLVSDFIANYKMKVPTLKQEKEMAVEFVKRVTNDLLADEYDWRVLKLMEKQTLGENVKDELEEVLNKKQKIREISNEAEAKIKALQNSSEIEGVLEWMSEEFRGVVDG